MITKWVKAFVDLILYSNLWIATGALAMSLQTQLILSGTISPNSLDWFIFASTLFLYAIHRLVGLQKVKSPESQSRYIVIAKFKSHIFFYAVVSGIASLYYFLQFGTNLQLYIVLPSLISLAYVLPVLYQGKRLRDVGVIKIFLIAVSWAVITVLLPVIYLQQPLNNAILLLLLERALFVFAITIPFDIRDLSIDHLSNVSTIPGVLGVKKSILVSYICLLANALLSSYLYLVVYPEFSIFLGVMLSLLCSSTLFYYTPKANHDYFYTGLVDGMLIFQFLLIICMDYLY